MRRAHRWWLGALGALLALPLLAVALLLWWVEPDSLRPALESQARERLGVALRIDGHLSWKLWPAFSVQSGPGALGVDSAAPLLRWQGLQFTLQWPGLHATAWQFDGVVIEGLQMSLQVDAAGRWNASALLDAMAATRSGSKQSAQALRIHPLRLRNADIQLSPRPGGSPWRLSKLDVDAKLDGSADGQQWVLADLHLSGELRGGTLTAAGEIVSVDTGRVAIELPRAGEVSGSVRVEPVQARLGAATLGLRAPQALRWQPLQGEGELQFDATTLRSWLAAQGIALPPTRDAAVLRVASLATHWKVTAEQVELSAMKLRLDDTQLQGRIAGRWQPPQDWQVDLQGDALDLDRYRRPDSDPGEPFRLPVEALRALPLNGSVRLQRLSAGGVVARDAVIGLRSDNAGAARKASTP